MIDELKEGTREEREMGKDNNAKRKGDQGIRGKEKEYRRLTRPKAGHRERCDVNGQRERREICDRIGQQKNMKI